MPEERVALLSLIDTCKDVIEAEFSPAGYNIGFNVGVAAGRTVMHGHCHVIPRYVGERDSSPLRIHLCVIFIKYASHSHHGIIYERCFKM
jgi:diadenosine tetraphosphate (Ap4A) HIT family hydrolase